MIFRRANWLARKWLASITLCNPREKIAHQEINFRPLFRILINTKFLVSVWYVLKQIFTPLSAKEVNIYLFASRLGISKNRSYYWIPLRWKLVDCSIRTWSFFLGKIKWNGCLILREVFSIFNGPRRPLMMTTENTFYMNFGVQQYEW